MSIYDDQDNEDTSQAPKPAADRPLDSPYHVASPPATVGGKFAEGAGEESKPARRRGCGCGSCLLALLLMGLICIAVCGIGGYLTYQNAPEWAHDAIVAAIDDSELDDESKRKITADMDRLLAEYRAGNVSGEQIKAALQEFGDSPILVLLMAYAAVENYIEPSGLADDEKAEAKLVLQRVARGTFEEEIDPDDLEEAFDFISKKDFQGNRKLKNKVSDADLRAFVDECKRVADKAEVPNEPYQVDVAAEVKRIVDRALGITPDEELEPDPVEPTPQPNPGPDPDAPEPVPDAGETAALTNVNH